MFGSRADWRRARVFGAAVLIIAAGCDTGSPSAPSSQVVPVVRSIQISGPESIPPGEPVQFTATLVSSDGSTQDVTEHALWDVGSEASYEGHGFITGRRIGEMRIFVRLSGPEVSGRKQVVIVPDGTFRVSGRVVEWDALSGPISGARIEVVGNPTMFALTGPDGTYRLYGVPTGTELRVTKNGYAPETRRLEIEQHYTANFELKLVAPRENLAGPFSMTITADPACTQPAVPFGPLDPVPQEHLQRTYTITITPTGNRLKVFVSGPTVVPPSHAFDSGFAGTSEPGRMFIQLGSYASSVFEGSPSGIVEMPTASSYLVVDGMADVSTDTMSGTLNGSFWLLSSDPWKTAPAPIATCFSKTHQIRLTR